MPRLFAYWLACLLVMLNLAGCKQSALTRPYGYLRIGTIQELMTRPSFLPEDRLYLRHDDRGWSVMSTLCTYDLSPLHLERDGEKEIWVSRYSESRYSVDGAVIHGPAIAPLPYYKLAIDGTGANRVKNTLYVEIGREVSSDWRFQPPSS